MHLKDHELAAALSAQLGDDKLLAAAYVRVHTALSPARLLTPLGNYLIARPAARAAAKKMTTVSEIPMDASVVLGISPTGLHVWRADPMLNQVQDYLGHVPLQRITNVHVEPGRSWQPFTLSLDDGTQLNLEGRGAIHEVATQFGQLAAAR